MNDELAIGIVNGNLNCFYFFEKNKNNSNFRLLYL
jgi:hypothetical protein